MILRNLRRLCVALMSWLHLKFTKAFIIECDASRHDHVGVVLMQEGRFLSFETNKLKGKDLVKTIYEKEMLSILHAFKK